MAVPSREPRPSLPAGGGHLSRVAVYWPNQLVGTDPGVQCDVHRRGTPAECGAPGPGPRWRVKLLPTPTYQASDPKRGAPGQSEVCKACARPSPDRLRSVGRQEGADVPSSPRRRWVREGFESLRVHGDPPLRPRYENSTTARPSSANGCPVAWQRQVWPTNVKLQSERRSG